jgi:curved DNA-binding protein CbpA
MPRDLYAALGRPRTEDEVKLDGHGPDVPLDRTASPEEVEQAWIAAAKRHHPDRNPSDPGGAATRFRTATLAHTVIGDSKSRAEYDAGRWVDPEDPVATATQNAPGWHQAIRDPERRKILSDVIESACVLGGLDKDAAGMASDVVIGAVASAADVAKSPDTIGERVTTALGAAAKKFTHPEGRADLRVAGQSAQALWRSLFGKST